tara:strand:- start:266 stop:421 length:156 start_codon:yes stop_codon:yes gene_type:complete
MSFTTANSSIQNEMLEGQEHETSQFFRVDDDFEMKYVMNKSTTMNLLPPTR